MIRKRAATKAKVPSSTAPPPAASPRTPSSRIAITTAPSAIDMSAGVRSRRLRRRARVFFHSSATDGSPIGASGNSARRKRTTGAGARSSRTAAMDPLTLSTMLGVGIAAPAARARASPCAPRDAPMLRRPHLRIRHRPEAPTPGVAGAARRRDLSPASRHASSRRTMERPRSGTEPGRSPVAAARGPPPPGQRRRDLADPSGTGPGADRARDEHQQGAAGNHNGYCVTTQAASALCRTGAHERRGHSGATRACRTTTRVRSPAAAARDARPRAVRAP